MVNTFDIVNAARVRPGPQQRFSSRMSSQAAVTSAFAARISGWDAALRGCTSCRKQREIAGSSLMSDPVAPSVVTAPSVRDLMHVNRRNARRQCRLPEMSVPGRRRSTLASRMPNKPFMINADSPTRPQGRDLGGLEVTPGLHHQRPGGRQRREHLGLTPAFCMSPKTSGLNVRPPPAVGCALRF